MIIGCCCKLVEWIFQESVLNQLQIEYIRDFSSAYEIILYWKFWVVPELGICAKSRAILFINFIASYYVFCEASTLADNEDATRHQLPANCGTFGIPCILFLLALYWGPPTTNVWCEDKMSIIWLKRDWPRAVGEGEARRFWGRASESHVTIISHNVHCQCRPRARRNLLSGKPQI